MTTSDIPAVTSPGPDPEPNTFEEEVKAMRSMRKKFDSLPTRGAKKRVWSYLNEYLRQTLGMDCET